MVWCNVYILVAMWTGLLYGQSEKLFVKGNSCYQQGDYQKALEYYQAIEKPSSSVLYNMGNCFYNLNNMLDALVYWSRSQKTAGIRDLRDIQIHKLLAYKALNLARADPLFYNIYIPFFYIQGIVLLLWFFVSAVIFFLRGWLRWFLLIAGMAMLIFGSCVLYRESHTRGALFGYTHNNEELLFAGPGSWYHQIGSVPCATCVEIIQEKEGWYAIRTDTVCGWVPSHMIKVI